MAMNPYVANQNRNYYYFHFRQAEKNSWCRTCQRSVEFFPSWTNSSVFLAFAAFLQVKFANVGIKTRLLIDIATGNFFYAYCVPVVLFQKHSFLHQLTQNMTSRFDRNSTFIVCWTQNKKCRISVKWRCHILD